MINVLVCWAAAYGNVRAPADTMAEILRLWENLRKPLENVAFLHHALELATKLSALDPKKPRINHDK